MIFSNPVHSLSVCFLDSGLMLRACVLVCCLLQSCTVRAEALRKLDGPRARTGVTALAKWKGIASTELWGSGV